MIFLVLPDLPQEDALLAKARQGNQDAVMQIYESYFDPIYEYIRLRVADRPLAEDLASEVFLELVRVVRGPRAPHSSLRGWLFQVARNMIAAHYRAGERLPTTTLDEWLPAPSEDDPEVQFIRTLGLESARRAVQSLSGEQQEVIVLRFGQKLSLQETADIMGKSVSAIKSLQFRAIETLRHRLAELRTGEAYG